MKDSTHWTQKPEVKAWLKVAKRITYLHRMADRVYAGMLTKDEAKRRAAMIPITRQEINDFAEGACGGTYLTDSVHCHLIQAAVEASESRKGYSNRSQTVSIP